MGKKSVQTAKSDAQSPDLSNTSLAPKLNNSNKILIIILGLLLLITTGATGYFAYQNYQLKKQALPSQPLPIHQGGINNLSQSPNNNLSAGDWQPIIEIDEYYWNSDDWFAVEQHQDIISFANNYISQKVGIDYFDKHFQLSTSESSISQDGKSYYLRYDLFIPSKGIVKKGTTHPTSFYFKFKKSDNQIIIEKDGLSNIAPDDISVLKQETFINKNQALNIAKTYIQKDFPLPEKALIDFGIFFWKVSYDISKELSPQCEFGMGARIILTINALTQEVSEQIDCNFPGV